MFVQISVYEGPTSPELKIRGMGYLYAVPGNYVSPTPGMFYCLRVREYIVV